MDSSNPLRPPAPALPPAPATSSSVPPVPTTVNSTSNVRFSRRNEIAFRILCPASKTGRLYDIPGARIRVVDESSSVPSTHDERVILVSSVPQEDSSSTAQANSDGSSHSITGSNVMKEEGSPAQQALVRVFERIVALDEEEKEKGGDERGSGEQTVVCRLLVDSNQVGSAGWKERKLLERIMQESGASLRVQPKDQIPPGASPRDELIEMMGSISTVKKALVSISGSLQENSGVDYTNSGAFGHSGSLHSATDTPAQVERFPPRGHPSGRHHSDYHRGNHPHVAGPENVGSNRRMSGEEEVVFKLLCHQEKVGSLIGKGGSVIRVIENDTGAYIKITDGLSDTNERVVAISARENAEQKGSPAQEAVMRVHHRIAEIGFEPGNAVVARLYVPSPQVRYLLGKGGSVVNEMRRATPASIRIFPRDQAPKFAAHNDEVVQVVGNLQDVQDALFQITSRIRETMFPFRHHHYPSHAPASYMPPFSDMPPPHVRPRHNPHSPGPYPPPPGAVPHGHDFSIPPRPLDHPPPFPRGMDPNVPPNGERVPYHYGGERPGYGPPFDRPPSPRSWNPQPYGGNNPRGVADFGSGVGSRSGPHGSGNQGPVMTNSTVEVVIPQSLLGHVHGENDGNLLDIRQISRAKVDIYGPKPGATEGVVVVAGTPDQVHAAQSLIHAFIFCGQAF